ncbi:MAG TPA: imidazoleglycerol-phosphate dehydratase HisB [Syntrophorhabdaceae bacterium]|nr:imidazoleglycerol-phosphate dehydratase HisB [Syntrophorhabdaceae bacterium]
MERKAKVERKTKETSVTIKWTLDGSGTYTISTGIPFFDHMLSLFAKHGLFDLEVKAKGDIEVDYHHTVEDIGIAMGEALKDALGPSEGIERYGYAIIPMDEALCMFACDLGGRPTLVWKGRIAGRTGDFDLDVVKEFFQGFVNQARVSIHVNLLTGSNLHHKTEAIFKAFGRSLRDAAAKNQRIKGVLSTKGVL